MTTVHGATLTDLSAESLRAATESLLDRYELPSAADGDGDGDGGDDPDEERDRDRVVLLPDAHYPFHPSTGLVTNPEFVAAAARVLVDRTDADRVGVACPSTEWIDAERATRFLGYERFADDDETPIETIDLDAADRRSRRVHLTRESVTIDVPVPLDEAAVVPVPTLRHDAAFGVAAGMVALGRAVVASPSPAEVQAAVRELAPAATLLDGTYTYTGEPRKSRFVLGSDNVVAVENLAALLVGADREDAPHLDSYEGESNRPTSVEGVSAREIAASLPRKPPREAGDDRAMRLGYRLYAAVSGDNTPPMYLGGGDGE